MDFIQKRLKKLEDKSVDIFKLLGFKMSYASSLFKEANIKTAGENRLSSMETI